MSFLIRLLVNAAALWVTTRIVPGVTYSGEFLPFLAVALVFGIVNAFIGPVAKLLALPLIILTLGIFALVVNGCAGMAGAQVQLVAVFVSSTLLRISSYRIYRLLLTVVLARYPFVGELKQDSQTVVMT
jgi:uncharacterized membrane protein YvlD (DUF360 family)